MKKHIRDIRIEDVSLDPAQAVLRIEVELADAVSDLKILGRLMGPRCLYSSTVEVAYPLRPVAGAADERCKQFRVVIPEPSLWDPQSPFLYEGPVEAWQGGQRLEAVPLSHGLRTLTLGPRSLRLNGRPLSLHGVQVAQAGAEELAAWRQRGVNLLVVALDSAATSLLELADQHGFLVVGRPVDKMTAPPDVGRHPSWLGWTGSASDLPGVLFNVCPIEQAADRTMDGVPLLAMSASPPTLPGSVGSDRTIVIRSTGQQSVGQASRLSNDRRDACPTRLGPLSASAVAS